MIRIHLLEGKAFVWNYADVRRIREEHCIVGVLVGALPRKPRQNVRLGLPLELLPEEARLLLDKGLAILVRSPTSQSLGHGKNQDALFSEKVNAYEKELEENYQEQLRLSAEQKKTMMESLADHISQGRAKKRQRKGGGGGDLLAKPAESGSCFVFPRESMVIQLPTARSQITQEEAVDWHVASQLWPYAGQELHEMRYLIFRDLWERGYYVTTGSKFGGDFLVYPGDPMRFHAHYIALCFSKDTPISLYDIISAGRLGTNVKKTVLLCSVEQEGTVAYTSLQWSGMQ
ncbi:PREDICTED: tRNA-splicing endonuclease subunit Sen34 [Thamnophis sirtalis]|uniref:tRNA-splicing endonuclease subunit Sen34 n=1 Tax=Thamnophis sirtalis TaxID=35019 RepID=A0A6I9XK84_9SAUR|nr:PREDICTED: tRNA-splicing endonuclease subunit Sen34 [Thamnophis sirtalis]XP_013916209.1 PREDICTED: tRNA-splicing endonuclease subunit Sen34 [Thamnophis sirtalis]